MQTGFYISPFFVEYRTYAFSKQITAPRDWRIAIIEYKKAPYT
jgi:hypothetical protein